MATSALPLLLGVGALFLLKSKGKDAPAAAAAGTATTETDVGGGAAAGTGNGSGGAGTGTGTGTTATGSSGYKNVSAAMMETIQKQLIQLDYDPGAADGQWRFGGTTYKAVKKFQGDNNLEDDGKPGPITRAKLNEMTATSSDDSSEGESPPGNGGSPGGGASSSDVSPTAMPATEADQVGINIDLSQIKIGTAWRFTLHNWLDIQRKAGWIVTKENEVPPTKFLETHQYTDAATFINQMANSMEPGTYLTEVATSSPIEWSIESAAEVANFLQSNYQSFVNWAGWFGSIGIDKKNLIAANNAWAVYRYIQTHNVIVGPDKVSVKIRDLGTSPQVAELLDYISEQVTYFQKSTFDL